MSKILQFAFPIVIGLCLWFMPSPEGIDEKGWHLFAIFVATICGLIAKPLPMGAVTIISLLAAVLTGTLKLEQEALGGFSSCVIWLVVFVFFIARGFIKTQLGLRIAFFFVKLFGKSSLGLGYSLAFTELLISPAIPSSGARAGGIIYPIMKSISESLGSSVEAGTERKLGGFLTQVCYQSNLITSAMFLTAMAANPMMQSFAQSQGIEITWTNWAIAAAVPGILSMIIIPLIVYMVYPPELKKIPGAVELAQGKLKAMGPISVQEWMMTGIFALMLGLWIVGDSYGISSTTTGIIGLCLLLVTGILTWDDILGEKDAWHTLIWFSILVMMAKYLQVFGVIAWFSNMISGSVSGMDWHTAFISLVLIYFYSHYFFASNTSHISAMYAAFLAVAVGVGTPPLLAALVLGFCSSLFASTTHFGASGAAVFFGTGFVPVATWWYVGLIVSFVNIAIWGGIGSVWWKALGLW